VVKVKVTKAGDTRAEAHTKMLAGTALTDTEAVAVKLLLLLEELEGTGD
jgi:hypothetical protein